MQKCESIILIQGGNNIKYKLIQDKTIDVKKTKINLM